MRGPTALVPAGAALVAALATGLPVLLHSREPDVVNLAAGLVLLVSGAHLSALDETRSTARMLLLASVAWFLPDLAADAGPLGSALASSSLLHVVPLVTAVVMAPDGRLPGRAGRAAVLTAAVAAGSAVTGGYQVLVPAAGLALVAVSVKTALRAGAGRMGPVRAHLVAVVSLAAALTGVPVIRLLAGSQHEEELFVVYAALLALCAVALVRGGPWPHPAAVVDVGPDALTSLDDLIAELTGDPHAHALVHMGRGDWVRLDGRPATPPAKPSGTVAVMARTPVPPRLEPVLGEALRLAGRNVRARRRLEQKVSELDDLRARLVRVEDEERAALVARLRSGPIAALVALRGELAASGAPLRVLERVTATQADLEHVAAGLDPLEGNTSYLTALAALADAMGAGFRAAPGLTGEELDGTAALALWFASSEALTNAAKHAPGAPREIRIDEGTREVVAVVSDHGPGPGAAAEAGLVGVRDRVAAAGGTMTVTGSPAGTEVAIRFPATRHHVRRSGAGADAAAQPAFLASSPPTAEA